MSLQIWLPLNGNLENQGLTDIEATNVGATGNANGKIGSCYHFDGTSSRIGFPEIAISYPISICAWIKGETITASGTEYILSYNTPAGGTSGHAIGFGTYTGKLSIWHGGTVHSYGTALTNNIWYHVAAVVTESSYGLYLDGNLVLSGSGTQTAVNSKCITIGARSNNSGGGAAGAAYFFKGFMNDVRLYDHALSAKEVRELAKGLVLHYKLDDGYVEGTTNLVPYPKKTGAVSAAWDSTLHPDAITVSGWANGYNRGVSNPETGYHAYWKTIENISTMVYNNINSDYGMKGRWMGINCSVSNVGINANDTYTISFDIKTTSKRQTAFPYVFGGWYYKRTSDATSRSFHDGYFYASNTKLGEWEHFSITKQRVSTYDNNGEYEAFYLYGQSSTEGTMYVRNFQVEKKDHSTPYAGSTGSRSASIVYDSSGFGYNGTPANVETSDSSARYSRCLRCPQSASSILIGNLSTMVPEGIFTFNVWFKKVTDEWGSKWWETIFGGPSGFELESKNGNVSTPYLVNYNWSPRTNIPYDLDKWNMVTMVRTTSETKFYLNGELKVTASAGSIPSGNYYLASWRDINSQNYRGYLSDARIYSTALSADDILELYHTSASIDKSGSIYARELVE